ncbi:MAG: NAD(P)-dependent oxidoreductase [Pseudomonadota bacterium]
MKPHPKLLLLDRRLDVDLLQEMDLSKAQIAVTGATGFLGRYIVDALLRRGTKVVGVVRNTSRVPELLAKGVEMRKADLRQRDQMAQGFVGVDAVVSNAALFSLHNRNWEDHFETNIQGTQNIFDAMIDVGVRRIIHISSTAVYQKFLGERATEDHPKLSRKKWRWGLGTYAASKAFSEQRAWELAEEHRLQLTVIRPGGIYGAFDSNLTSIVKRMMRWPIAPVPVFTRLSFVYAGDVAEAIALALEKPIAIGKAYNVTGEEQTIWQFLKAWKEAGGKSPMIKIPFPFPYRWLFDNNRAKKDLGWGNSSYVDGLKDTFAQEPD